MTKASHEFKQLIEIQVGNKLVPTTYGFKCYLDDITYVQEHLDVNGYPLKNVCKINHKDKGEMLILGSYQKVSSLIFREHPDKPKLGYGKDKNENIGFKRGKGSH